MSLFKKNISQVEEALKQAEANLVTANEANTAHEATIINITEQLATSQTELAGKATELTETTEKLTNAEASIVTLTESQADFDGRLAADTATAVAALGHQEPIKDAKEDEKPMDLMETFKSLKGAELAEFYEANKTLIFG